MDLQLREIIISQQQLLTPLAANIEKLQKTARIIVWLKRCTGENIILMTACRMAPVFYMVSKNRVWITHLSYFVINRQCRYQMVCLMQGFSSISLCLSKT
jgi:hypothetical protein